MKKSSFYRSFLKNVLRLFALFLIVVIIMMVFTDSVVRPVVLGYAENMAEIEATKMINGAIKQILEQDGFEYSEYVDIITDGEGNITAVTADTVELNILIAKIILKIQNDISRSGVLNFKVPLGNVTGSAYFIGRGPKLPMSVSVSTAVHHSVTSEFSDAGVNQTLHRMVLHISTGAYVMVPFYTASTTAEIQMPLAETVIVGKVPDAFTVVIEGSNSDMSGKIFDYSAVS